MSAPYSNFVRPIKFIIQVKNSGGVIIIITTTTTTTTTTTIIIIIIMNSPKFYAVTYI